MEKAGFLLVNKPKDISSYDCIRHLKRIIKEQVKIGHAGTLDPFAEGLLLVAINREATRLIDNLMHMDKEYVATVKLGELTDTLDCTGTVISQEDVASTISEKQLRAAVTSFLGNYEQIPPAYSALKHEGVPLYKLAREQKVNEETMDAITKDKARTVIIHAIELVEFKPPFFTVKTTVSKGTYVRSLMNDIAKKLNTVATTYELTRTRIGPFDLRNAIPLDAFTSIQVISTSLIPYQVAQTLIE